MKRTMPATKMIHRRERAATLRRAGLKMVDKGVMRGRRVVMAGIGVEERAGRVGRVEEEGEEGLQHAAGLAGEVVRGWYGRR